MDPGDTLKVVHVISGLSTGGAENFLLRLIEAHRGANISSAVISLGRGGAMASRFKESGIEVVELGLSSYADWRRIPAAVTTATDVLSRCRPEVIQGWMNHGNVAATALKQIYCRRAKLIWSIRQTLADIRNEKAGTRAMIRLQSLLSRYPDAIICNSNTGLEDHVRIGFRSERAQVVPNGFDTRVLRPSTGERMAARAALGIEASDFAVGLVGRLHPMKDHETFFNAVAIAARSASDLRARCIGGGEDEYRAGLEQKLSTLGIDRICKVVGERQDVGRLYAAFDAVCLTSAWGEGFPNAVGEAMACGIPCVVTDVGDCAQIVADTGYVSLAKEPSDIANGILHLRSIGDAARKELGGKARERIARNYSIPSVSNRYLAVYRELLGRNG